MVYMKYLVAINDPTQKENPIFCFSSQDDADEFAEDLLRELPNIEIAFSAMDD